MLSAALSLLAGLHTLGAALGAGGATFAEIFYTKATADGVVDTRERAWFETTHFSLRWGMMTVLITGIALIVLEYFEPNAPQTVLFAPLWVENLLALLITITAWFMARDKTSWWLGSAVIFAGWWFLLALDAWRAIPLSFLALIFSYVLLVFISAALWGYARMLAKERSAKKTNA